MTFGKKVAAETFVVVNSNGWEIFSFSKQEMFHLPVRQYRVWLTRKKKPRKELSVPEVLTDSQHTPSVAYSDNYLSITENILLHSGHSEIRKT